MTIAPGPPQAQSLVYHKPRHLPGGARPGRAFSFSVRLSVSFHHPLSTAVRVTTSNPYFSLAREKLSPLFPSSLSGQLACCCRSQGTLHGASAFATTLLPEHPVPGEPRSTIAHSKLSDSCADRSSGVCSVRSSDELRIRRSGV